LGDERASAYDGESVGIFHDHYDHGCFGAPFNAVYVEEEIILVDERHLTD
jgi:hypothetical protein